MSILFRACKIRFLRLPDRVHEKDVQDADAVHRVFAEARDLVAKPAHCHQAQTKTPLAKLEPHLLVQVGSGPSLSGGGPRKAICHLLSTAGFEIAYTSNIPSGSPFVRTPARTPCALSATSPLTGVKEKRKFQNLICLHSPVGKLAALSRQKTCTDHRMKTDEPNTVTPLGYKKFLTQRPASSVSITRSRKIRT